jgi:membrane-bound lytic murein transglycosylase B
MRQLTHILIILMFSIPSLGSAGDIDIQKRIASFINEVVKEHKFDRAELEKQFSQFKIVPKIIKSMNNQAESKKWFQYRPIFLQDKRARQGVKFWQENESVLNRATEKFGIPAEIIVAIIGVETRYGKHKGKFSVFKALSTLAFSYPRRSKFYTSQLKHFLLLAREENINPLSFKGSYAGAMGIGQFIPSSYRAYAIDFDGDGKRDLMKNKVDAIGSVANYFSKHHWYRDEGTAYPVSVTGKNFKKGLTKKIKPKHTLAQLKKYGVKIPKGLNLQRKAKLIQLTTKTGKEYWLGMHNFNVITRYNPSTHYGMAVFQLSQKILKLKQSCSKEG